MPVDHHRQTFIHLTENGQQAQHQERKTSQHQPQELPPTKVAPV
jgi:hypothetical protein